MSRSSWLCWSQVYQFFQFMIMLSKIYQKTLYPKSYIFLFSTRNLAVSGFIFNFPIQDKVWIPCHSCHIWMFNCFSTICILVKNHLSTMLAVTMIQYLMIHSWMEDRIILAHSYRGFSLWSVGPVALMCVKAETSWWKGGVGGHCPPLTSPSQPTVPCAARGWPLASSTAHWLGMDASRALEPWSCHIWRAR